MKTKFNKSRTVPENINIPYSHKKNLSFKRDSEAVLLSDGKTQIGYFKVWFYDEDNKREYIIINNTMIYIDELIHEN